MSGLIAVFLVIGNPAWAGKAVMRELDFNDQKIQGVNLGLKVRGRAKPSEDEVKRLSERIFDQFEDLLLEIDATEESK